MNWLPPPLNFRDRLRSVLQVTDPASRLESLVALVHHCLGYVEALQLDQALASLTVPAVAPLARVRVALLGSSTLDHLLPFLRVAGLRRGLFIEAYAGLFGQYRLELADPTSALHAFRPDVVVLSIAAREAVGAVAIDASVNDAERAIDSAVGELRGVWAIVREKLRATVVQQTFLDVAEPLFGSHDRLVAGAPRRLVAQLNDRVVEAAAQDQVLLVDVAAQSARDGIDAWFDVARWLQGKMEISPQAAPRYGELLARIIAAQLGRSRKCLVLDLDNTLWGGVVGEVGLNGIVLGEGSALGEAHLSVQRYAKRLSERGIILAVCSKNDPAVAEAVFRDHPEMLLRRADIAAFVANWADKAENIRAIAQQLNIGLDSLVFVDDNPAERARVRESLPEVAVPELPQDPALYVRCIADAGYFEAVGFTVEDRQRAGQYAVNAELNALKGVAQSMDEFLRGLEMSVAFGPVTPVNLARVTQLLNKTNQFNTTTRRYTADEVAALAALPDGLLLQFRLLDRFADNGLVSVMILRCADDEADVLEIDNWVMSCRVFGRQLEHEAMNIAVEAALARGMRALRAAYLPTERNGVVAGLYESLGFARVADPADAHGASRWMLNLADYAAQRTLWLQHKIDR